MGSIPRIVSTPLKWVSKKLIHRTLLRFPGGNPHDPIACTYCPEMCRFSCPTAVVSGNDAVTPCNKMGLLHKEERWPGKAAAGGPLWPLYDCTGCGRCTEYCVYGMPVADQLFEARQRFGWERSRKLAAELADGEDPVGDLADELGDGGSAQRRAEAFVRSCGDRVAVDEPRSAFFLAQRGFAAGLSWEAELGEARLPAWRERLAGGTWLVHESVWMSRRSGRYAEVRDWADRARALGVSLEFPFRHGKDCVDCGGEGAYSRLFPEQAGAMAREIWERDRHRARGILCFSARCAWHLRRALGPEVPVVSLAERET